MELCSTVVPPKVTLPLIGRASQIAFWITSFWKSQVTCLYEFDEVARTWAKEAGINVTFAKPGLNTLLTFEGLKFDGLMLGPGWGVVMADNPEQLDQIFDSFDRILTANSIVITEEYRTDGELKEMEQTLNPDGFFADFRLDMRINDEPCNENVTHAAFISTRSGNNDFRSGLASLALKRQLSPDCGYFGQLAELIHAGFPDPKPVLVAEYEYGDSDHNEQVKLEILKNDQMGLHYMKSHFNGLVAMLMPLMQIPDCANTSGCFFARKFFRVRK